MAAATPTSSVTVQVVRFYVPAIGAISLLGAWLVSRIPGRSAARSWLPGAVTAAGIVVLFVWGAWTFHAMYEAYGVPLGG